MSEWYEYKNFDDVDDAISEISELAVDYYGISLIGEEHLG
jgi:hypothetical protein